MAKAKTKHGAKPDAPRTVPVLLPLALPAPYDYLLPDGTEVEPGQFVVAPLGTVEYLAAVWRRPADAPPPELDRKRLRAIVEVIDDVPPLPLVSLDFADWVANYTLSSPGMVLRMMMSAGRAFDPPAPRYGVRLIGAAPARMTPARARVLEAAKNGLIWVKSSLAEAAGVSPGVIDGLVDAGVLIAEPLPDWHARTLDLSLERAKLTLEQGEAARQLLANTEGGFAVTLLDGVTGSGKTEVYFEAIAAALAAGRQVLVLMPEIALTPSSSPASRRRFGARPAEWHSGVSARERGARLARASPRARRSVVVGARSALFLPFRDLGLIVVDEEHDRSYKQEDGVAYQARDMAVVRGSLGRLPVVLASATPSIETPGQCRAAAATGTSSSPRATRPQACPSIAAIDMRARAARARPLARRRVLVAAVDETLERGEQALLFLNRRGYAPLTLCRKCGHRFECPNCSAWLVEHRFRAQARMPSLRPFVPTPEACPKCGAEHSLVPCGPGIERIAEEVAERFPGCAPRAAVERPHAARISRLRETLREIEEREVDVIIGTQLVAKGHHFPGLTLVGVVDADLGLAHRRPARRRAHLPAPHSGDRARRAATTIPGRGADPDLSCPSTR